MMNGFYGYMGYSWIVGIFLIIILLFVVIAIIKKFGYSKDLDFYSRGDSSINILKERYAKGEISEEEYLRIYNNLRNRQ